MEKNLYIDASHPDETRVVLKENGNIEDYEYETVKNNLIKNLWKRIYISMHRIRMKLGLFLSLMETLKITNLKV